MVSADGFRQIPNHEVEENGELTPGFDNVNHHAGSPRTANRAGVQGSRVNEVLASGWLNPNEQKAQEGEHFSNHLGRQTLLPGDPSGKVLH